MTTIALLGDSTYQTYYLNTATNAALIANQPPNDLGRDWQTGDDRRLHIVLQEALTAQSVTATTTNYALGGWDSTEALTLPQVYLGTGTQTQWEACKASVPDIVVVNYGFNDQAAGISKATFKTNIETIVNEAQDAGIIPVLANNAYLQYGSTMGATATARNAAQQGYRDAMQELADEYHLTFIDIAQRFQDSYTAGTWDLFGHNDSQYYASWENGTSAPDEAFYANVHQWTGGTALMADEMADILIAYEPLLGGSYDHFKSELGVYPKGHELDVVLLTAADLDVQLDQAAPTLTAVAEDDGVALSWNDMPNETAYEILKSFEDIASNSFVTASTVAADTTSYKDSAVTAQHTYKYAVRPLYAVGDDPNSNLEQVTIPPVVTTSDAEASYVGPAVITLSRTGGVSPLTTYYKLNGGATQTATALTATAQGQNTIQYWSVDSGESPYTEPTRTETFTIASAVTTPTTPASLSVIFTDRITATSAVSTGATSYEFSRSVNGGAYSVVQDTSALTYVDTALVAGNTYTYRVRGHNSAGYSDYRVSETLTPVAPILEWSWTERRSKAVPVWTERPARVQEDSE